MTLDDATGAIYSAFLVEEEGTASTFRALKEVFSAHGLPMSLYTDRGAHYFRTAKAGEIDRKQPTQVGRALEQRSNWGSSISGPSRLRPGGRSERAFATLQDRLVKELALAGIASIEAANAFIREVYLPAHNQRFAVQATEPGSAFTPIPGVDLDEILCVQEERQVMNDNCVSYRTLKLQIPPSPMRAHFVRPRVKVHVYPDGSHAVFHGPRCIGRYDEKGTIKLLHRVQFGGSGRQEDRRDVAGHVEVASRVPSGAVEQQHGVGALGDTTGDFFEMELHGLGVGEGQGKRGPDAAGGTNGAEQIGVVVTLIGGLARPRPALCPLPDLAVLLADAGLVLEPDLDRRRLRQAVEMGAQRA